MLYDTGTYGLFQIEKVLTTDPEVARREAAERVRRLKALKEMQKQKEEKEGT